jgi:RNA polymerase sigma factor (TIGR02999 family)
MQTEVERLLAEWNDGDESARDRLVPLVYGELRRLAGGFLRRERAGHTLQPTALVNEALLRLFQQRNVPAEGRQQFFGLIAQLMRRVLVDHARKRHAAKRGGPATYVTLDERLEHAATPNLVVLDVDRALGRLEAMDERQARIVELRVFGGFEVDDVATALDISPATVKREWRSALAWLHRELAST